MLMNFKNKWKITDRMEIFEDFDASVLMQLVIEENSIVMSAETTLVVYTQS